VNNFFLLTTIDFRATALPAGDYWVYMDLGRNDNSGQYTIHGYGLFANPPGINPMHANGTCLPI